MLKSIILRPYKQWYQGRLFELFWSAAGFTQYVSLSGMLLRVSQTLSASPGLIFLRLSLHPLRKHLISSEYFTELEGNFCMSVCV